MSNTLITIIVILYLAVGLVVIRALDKIFYSEFNVFSIFCIFTWPLVVGIILIFEIVSLLYDLGGWIGEKINSWL